MTTVLAVAGASLGAGSAAGLPGLPALPGLPGLPNGSIGAPPASKAELNKSFQKLVKSMAKNNPGRLGIALTPGGSEQTMSFGSLKSARAWSTLKVPVSIAAQRAGGRKVLGDEDKAIKASDNDAAEALWASIGGGRASVDAVTAVLREGHDRGTHVASQVDGPSSYPGYTAWSLANQSVFAAHLPCVADSAEVLDFMGHVAANQQWGVAKTNKRGVSSAVKGGWGPVSDNTGKYVVRQLAVIKTARGNIGVSLAAQPASGSFEDGKAMVTKLGQWVLRNVDKLAAGDCIPVNLAGAQPEVAQPEAAQPEAEPAPEVKPEPEAAPEAAPETATQAAAELAPNVRPAPTTQVQPEPAVQVAPAH